MLLRSGLRRSDHLQPPKPLGVAEDQGGPGLVAVDQEPPFLEGLEIQITESCATGMKRTFRKYWEKGQESTCNHDSHF